MTLRLVIESAPRPQPVSEMLYEGGRLSIGRSEDADWQLDDPEMFVSRRHCILSDDGGQVVVTDASSGGLFIDNAANPVGAGNAVPVEPGMVLRLGDFTLRVEAAEAGQARTEGPAPRRPGGFDFGPPEEVAPAPERPASLPDPFGVRRGEGPALDWTKPDRGPAEPRPLDHKDPFELDLRGAPAAPGPEKRAETPRQRERPGQGYFSDPSPDDSQDRPDPRAELRPEPADVTPPRPDLFGDLGAPIPPQPDRTVAEPSSPEEDAPPILHADFSFAPPPATDPVPEAIPEPEPPADPAPAPVAPAKGASGPAAEGEAAVAALLRGLGMEDGAGAGWSEAELERVGASMRALVEGVMLLLRTRAKERQKVRVAQTIIASQNVNPLKFLATSDEALEALIRPRGRGYLAPEEALDEAFRDLTDHQVRTWTALQTALRRMVDKFDPAEIAREMEDVGRLESLLSGGRSAKLWQLYEERYREIARAAEEQFLGEVGADFREAYENQRRD